MRTCIFVYINTCISTCIRICVHTHGGEPIEALNVFVCKYTYTHTHTYTHTFQTPNIRVQRWCFKFLMSWLSYIRIYVHSAPRTKQTQHTIVRHTSFVFLISIPKCMHIVYIHICMFKHVFAVQPGPKNSTHVCYALLFCVFALKYTVACDSVYA